MLLFLKLNTATIQGYIEKPIGLLSPRAASKERKEYIQTLFLSWLTTALV